MTSLPVPRGRRATRTALLLAATVALGQLAACGNLAAPSSPDATSEGEPPAPLAELHTWGGMCPAGPCLTTLTVFEDGRWSWSDEAEEIGGVLEADDVDLLREAVSQTSLSPVPDDADAGTRCEADVDGRSVRVGWAAPGLGWQSEDSCEQPVAGDEPLVRQLEELAERLAP